jgi:hypothetical protein
MAFPASLIELVMTIRMKDLIFEYFQRGHALADGIQETELDSLVLKFQLRLRQFLGELDLSPESLKNLHDGLVRYYKQANQESGSFSDEENLQIVREFVAYLGRVVLDNKGGQWSNPGELLNVGVQFSGEFEAVKGDEVRKYPSSVANLGYLAAGIWDGVLMGIDIDIIQYYKMITQKRIKEHLGTKKHKPAT